MSNDVTWKYIQKLLVLTYPKTQSKFGFCMPMKSKNVVTYLWSKNETCIAHVILTPLFSCKRWL